MKNTVLDEAAYQRAQQRAAKTFQQASVLQQEIAQRLLEHLELVRLQPQIILDLGAKTGFTTQLLRQRYPQAQIIAADISFPMLQKNRRSLGLFKRQTCVTTTTHLLPFKNNSVDMVFSNLELNFADFAIAIKEINRILKPNGVLFFSALGPDTLKELRVSWSKVDSEIHVHEFIDMHDLGDELIHAGLLDPVMEMENLTFTYSKIDNLFKDLKQTGWQNAALQRNQFLTGKNHWQKMLQHYQNYRNENQDYLATYEIIYGHAWKSELPRQNKNEQGEVTVAIENLVKKR